MRRTGSYKWPLVISLAVMVNVGYGAVFYAFSELLGEDAAAREFSRTVPSASLGLAIIVSGALALATMLALATAGGPYLAGMLQDITGSYAVPWLAAAVMFGAAIPLTLSIGFRPTMPDTQSSKAASGF
jgi:hypothetical protein